MRSITHCPACQTQFFVTEEQLNKHAGKVRCGQCMHVFDAKAQFIAATSATDGNDSDAAPDTHLITVEPVAPVLPPNHKKLTDTAQGPDSAASSSANSNVDYEKPSYFDDAVSKTKLLLTKTPAGKSRRWMLAIGSTLLLGLAIMQSVYFLRNQIAMHYPATKPYLLNFCQQLTCTISLPKQIEFIVIDDSDMQEDEQHPGVMLLSSNLINKSTYNQAYPNLELTLTDTNDKPLLRRIFKPAEYLAANTNIAIADGFKAGEEVRINLAITTQDIAVSGYRLFVTY